MKVNITSLQNKRFIYKIRIKLRWVFCHKRNSLSRGKTDGEKKWVEYRRERSLFDVASWCWWFLFFHLPIFYSFRVSSPFPLLLKIKFLFIGFLVAFFPKNKVCLCETIFFFYITIFGSLCVSFLMHLSFSNLDMG